MALFDADAFRKTHSKAWELSSLAAESEMKLIEQKEQKAQKNLITSNEVLPNSVQDLLVKVVGEPVPAPIVETVVAAPVVAAPAGDGKDGEKHVSFNLNVAALPPTIENVVPVPQIQQVENVVPVPIQQVENVVPVPIPQTIVGIASQDLEPMTLHDSVISHPADHGTSNVLGQPIFGDEHVINRGPPDLSFGASVPIPVFPVVEDAPAQNVDYTSGESSDEESSSEEEWDEVSSSGEESSDDE